MFFVVFDGQESVLRRAYLSEGPADQALSAASISIADAAKANATTCPPLLCRVRLIAHVLLVANFQQSQ